jgi:glucose/arabinose dehydrogenase
MQQTITIVVIALLALLRADARSPAADARSPAADANQAADDPAGVHQAGPNAQIPVEVLTTGLVNPRGLAFRSDGSLKLIWDMTAHVLTNPGKARREDPRADVPGGMAYGMTALSD